MSEDDLLKKIGIRIVEIRNEKGIKQIDLAYNIDMDDGSLRKIEKGKINLTVKTLSRIAIGLGVETKDLFDFK
jgi:putative transcriptional regulator